MKKYNYFNEMKFDTSTSASEKTDKGTNMNGVGSGDNTTARKVQSDVSSKQIASANAKDVKVTGNIKNDTEKEALKKGAETVLNTIETNAQAYINANVQISSAIARQLYNAFQLTNKDFWTIIQHHVKWYLSNPGQEKLSENQRTNPTNLNMNTGAKANVGKAQPATDTSQSAPAEGGGQPATASGDGSGQG